MTSKFNTNTFFEMLPSIWRTFYEDRDVFSSVWEAMLRVQDVEYSTVFHVDDSKSLASTPITVNYPVVFETFSDWQSKHVPHAHYKYVADFDSTKAKYLGDSNPNYYRILISGHLLKYETQVYLDGRAIPSAFIVKTFEYFEEDGAEVYGTILYIDADKLQDYITGNPVNALSWLGNSSVGSAQLWPVISEIQEVTVYSFRDIVPITAVSDGSSVTFDITLDEGIAVDSDDSKAYIEAVKVSSLLTTTLQSTDSYLLTSKKALLLKGRVFRVCFSDKTSKKYVVSEDGQLAVNTPTGEIISDVYLLLNFLLNPDLIQITETSVRLLGNNTFYPGASVRVVDSTGTQSFSITDYTSSITFGRPVDLNTVQIVFLGTELNSVVLTDTELTLASPLNKDVVVRLEAVLNVEHTHRAYRTVFDTPSNTIELSTTNPMDLTPSHQEQDYYPVRVYGNGLLLTSDQYTITDTVTITLASTWPADSVFDVLYADLEDAESHTHTHQTIVIPANAVQKVLVLDELIDTDLPLEIIFDATLSSDPDVIDFIGTESVQFKEPISSGLLITVHGTRRDWRYYHDLVSKSQSGYGYVGQITSFDTVQDGLTEADVIYTKDTDYEITNSRVETNVKFDEGWLFNVSVDERTLANVWGCLIDFEKPSSQTYKDTLTTLLAANKAPSLVDNLVNFGSIILGSAYLEEAGISRGITEQDNQSYVVIEPVDKNSATFQLSLLDGAPVRIPQTVIPRMYAVNALLEVIDRDLSEIPWLAYFAEELSTDYRYAKRLDASSTKKLISRPHVYDTETGILTDYSVNFFEEEVRVGDMVKLEFSEQDISFLNAEEDLDLPVSVITKVEEIIDQYHIKLGVYLVPKYFGYGELSYGEGTYGGGFYVPKAVQYVVWTRKTRPVDRFLFLDSMPNETTALVDGEKVSFVNQELNNILKHFVFGVKIDWNRMVDADAIDALDKLIKTLKPAETTALVYTEFQNDDGIDESLGGSLVEMSPDMSVSGTREADAYFTGNSYLGAKYSKASEKTNLLYNPEQYSVGVSAKAYTYEPNPRVSPGDYYLVTSAGVLEAKSSDWFQLYGTHGLENLVLHTEDTGTGTRYVVDSGYGIRANGYSLRLDADTRMRVPNLRHYLSSPVSFRTQLTLNEALSPGASPVVFSLGGMLLGLQYVNANQSQFLFRESPTGTTITGGVFSPGSPVYVAVTHKSGSTANLYVNNSLVGTATAHHLEDFTEDLIIGAGDQVTIADNKSLLASLDETVLSFGVAWSPAFIAAQADTWSGPMGYGENGSPLSEQKAKAVFHYDREDLVSAAILDYSGQGNNGSLETDTALTNWRSVGTVSTPLPTLFDYHSLVSSGYYLKTDYGLIPVINEDGFTGDVLAPTISNRIQFNQLGKAYTYQDNGWGELTSNPGTLGASIAVDIPSPFVGFTSGNYVDPEGVTRSSQSGGLTLTNADSSVILTFGAKNSGAITSIDLNGTELLYFPTKQHALQQCWQVGNQYFLREAGADTQSPTENSVSRFISSESNTASVVTQTYTAYSSPYSYRGYELEASGDKLAKKVTADFFGNPVIFELDAMFELYSSIQRNAFMWMYSFSFDSSLTELYQFQVGFGQEVAGTPTKLSSLTIGYSYTQTASFRGGYIFSDPTEQYAVGFYHHGLSRPDLTIISHAEYSEDPANHIEFRSVETNTQVNGIAPGVKAKTRYLCVGTLSAVTQAFINIYETLENRRDSGNYPATKLNIHLGSNDLLYTGDSFSVHVQAVSNYNVVDPNFDYDLTLSVAGGDGTLSGSLTVTASEGVAVFSPLSFNKAGYKSLAVTGGGLHSNLLDVAINNLIPTLTSITPTLVNEWQPDFTLRAFGTNFSSPSMIYINDVSQPTVYVSPTEVRTAVQSYQVSTQGHYPVYVINPAPGGGPTVSKTLTVSPYPVIDDAHLSIDYTPGDFYVNSDQAFIITSRFDDTPLVVNTEAKGLIRLYASPVTSGLSRWTIGEASPYNGTVTITGSIRNPGHYTLLAEHSPESPTAPLYTYAATTAYFTASNYIPVITRISPPVLSPNATSAPAILIYGSHFAPGLNGRYDNLMGLGAQSRTTTFINTGKVRMKLQAGDILTRGQHELYVTNTFSLGTSNTVELKVSPNPVVITHDPEKLVLTATTNSALIGTAVPVTVAITDANGILADNPLGKVKIRISPTDPAYTGTYTSSAYPTASLAQFDVLSSKRGYYSIIASYSPDVTETTIPEVSTGLQVALPLPQVTRVSPTRVSPASVSMIVTVYGNNFFSPTDMLLYYPDSSTTRTPSFTYVNSGKITFTLSPNDFLTLNVYRDVFVENQGNGLGLSTNTVTNKLFIANSTVPVATSLQINPYPLNMVQGTAQTGTAKVSVLDQYGVSITGTGNVTLTLSPDGQYPGTGTYTQTVALSSGISSFNPNISGARTAGTYRFKATHGTYATDYADNTTSVAWPTPGPITCTPTVIDLGTTFTLTVNGANFIQSATAGVSLSKIVINDIPQNTIWVSATQITTVVGSSITGSAGSKTVKVTTSNNGSTVTSNSVTLTVNGPVNSYDFEQLPATISVSPGGYVRVYPSIGTPTQVASIGATVGSVSLVHCLNNLAGMVSGVATKPVIPAGSIAGLAVGATEVVELSAGMYSSINFDSTQTNNAVFVSKCKALGLSATVPLIIRAKKNPATNTAYPVVIQSRDDFVYQSSYTIGYQNRSPGDAVNYLRWYDMIIRGSGGSAILPQYAGLNSGVHGEDYWHVGHEYHRCAIVGEYDYRATNITPARFTHSTRFSPIHSPHTTSTGIFTPGQKQFVASPNGCTQLTVPINSSPRNDFLYRYDFLLSEYHRCVANNEYLISTRVNERTSIAFVIGANAPASGSQYGAPTGSTATSFVYISANSSGLSSTNYITLTLSPAAGDDGGTNAANIEQYLWNSSTGTYTWQPLVGGSLTSNQIQSPIYPATGVLINGVAQYPNVRFKVSGTYVFRARTYIGGVLTGAITDTRVQVTTRGASQTQCTLNKTTTPTAIKCAPHPTISGYVTSVFSVPVSVRLDNPQPLAANVGSGCEIASGYKAPMTTGDITYTLATTAYVSGWRIADHQGNLYGEVGVDGSNQILRCNMLDGFVNSYTNVGGWTGGLRLVKLGTAPTVGDQITLIIARGASLLPAELTLSTTTAIIQINTVLTSSGFPDFTAEASLINTAAPVTKFVDYLSVKSVNQGSGRAFAPGWPGDPNHGNYHPEYSGTAGDTAGREMGIRDFQRIYPHPNDCPGLRYDGGKNTKWGGQLYNVSKWVWDSGVVHGTCPEHGFYFHEPYGVRITNSFFRYHGRTGTQVYNRREDDFPTKFNVAGWSPSCDYYNNGSELEQFVVEDSIFIDCGLTGSGTANLSIAEIDGAAIIRNNLIEIGFNQHLLHTPNGTWATSCFIGFCGYIRSKNKTQKGFTGSYQNINYYFRNMFLQDGSFALDPHDLNIFTYMTLNGDPNVTYYNWLMSRSNPAPYWYLYYSFHKFPHLRYRDGTAPVESSGSPRRSGTKYRNRAYGHPRWSEVGKTDYSSPYMKLDSQGVFRPIYYGYSPNDPTPASSRLFFAGLQPTRLLQFENNTCRANYWNTGSTGYASWNVLYGNTLGAVPKGINPNGAYNWIAGSTPVWAKGAGTRFMVDFQGGMRSIVINNNVLSNSAITPLAFDTKSAGSPDIQWAANLQIQGANNTIGGTCYYYGNAGSASNVYLFDYVAYRFVTGLKTAAGVPPDV